MFHFSLKRATFEQSKKLLNKFLPNFFKNKKVKMEANITVMTVTNKIKNNFSSFLFNDEVIGWAAKENSKKRFKYKYDLWTIQSTFKWANRNILNYRNNKKRFTNFLVNRFKKLSKLNINKIYFSVFEELVFVTFPIRRLIFPGAT